MKFYNSNFAPNPRRVRVFLAEKGVSMPTGRGRSRQARAQDARIFRGQSVPGHSRARTRRRRGDRRIDRDLPLHRGPAPRAESVRRDAARAGDGRDVAAADRMASLLPIAQAFRHSHPRMAQMEDPQIAEWAAANTSRALRGMVVFDERLRDGRSSPATDSPSPTSQGSWRSTSRKPARIAIPPEHVHLRRWHEALRARPSAAA